MQIYFTEFYPIWTINVENTDSNVCMPIILGAEHYQLVMQCDAEMLNVSCW